jgi:plastocyanin
MRRLMPIVMVLAIAGGVTLLIGPVRAADYMPNGPALKWVSANPPAKPENQVVVLTVPLPGGDADSKEVASFGELYGYSPRTIFVHLNQPTEFSFWNLQSSEQHDLMLTSPTGEVLLHMQLPELKKTTVVLNFHREGLFNFYCTMHQPYMTGQIFVLPAIDGAATSGPAASAR